MITTNITITIRNFDHQYNLTDPNVSDMNWIIGGRCKRFLQTWVRLFPPSSAAVPLPLIHSPCSLENIAFHQFLAFTIFISNFVQFSILFKFFNAYIQIFSFFQFSIFNFVQFTIFFSFTLLLEALFQYGCPYMEKGLLIKYCIVQKFHPAVILRSWHFARLQRMASHPP